METPILLSEALTKAEAEAVDRAAEGIVTETAFFQAAVGVFCFFMLFRVCCAHAQLTPLRKRRRGSVFFLRTDLLRDYFGEERNSIFEVVNARRVFLRLHLHTIPR